jgi:hypothetical protein
MIKTLLPAAALLALLPAHADVSVTSPAFVYNETFDSLTSVTGAQPWVNDSTLPGWSLFISTGAAAPTILTDTGSSNAGSFRSFGDASSSERALGSTASGNTYYGSPASAALAGWIALALNNATGVPLSSFTLAYSGEQWRNGGNTAAQSLVLEYGFGATFASVPAWTAAGAAFNFTSPVATVTAAAVNGNTTGLVSGLGGTVSTGWAAGSTLWLRWADLNDISNDHGLGIDNLSVSVAAAPVPEPGAWGVLLAGLATVAFVSRRRG